MRFLANSADIFHMKTFLSRFIGSDRGASMVEYGLMVALVAVISVPAVSMVGHGTESTFNNIGESLAAGEGGGAGSESAPGGDDDSATPGGKDDDSATPGGKDDDSPAPGGKDDDSATPGDDDDSPAPGDKDDESPTPGDDNGSPGPGGSDDPSPADPGSEAVVASTNSSFTWWNSSRHGGEGAWKASVDYQNDHNRHQYLTLEITRTDDKGKTTTTRVNGFYVPATGKATYELWDNNLKVHHEKITGVVSVEVKVVSVTTSDQNWKPVTYPQYNKSTTVDAPKP